MAKSHSSKNSRAGRSYAQEIVTLLRVALSAALLIAAYSVNAASLVSMLMLIAAALIAAGLLVRHCLLLHRVLYRDDSYACCISAWTYLPELCYP